MNDILLARAFGICAPLDGTLSMSMQGMYGHQQNKIIYGESYYDEEKIRKIVRLYDEVLRFSADMILTAEGDNEEGFKILHDRLKEVSGSLVEEINKPVDPV